MPKAKKPQPAPPRCGDCGDPLDRRYLLNGWAIATHPMYCPARFRKSRRSLKTP